MKQIQSLAESILTKRENFHNFNENLNYNQSFVHEQNHTAEKITLSKAGVGTISSLR